MPDTSVILQSPQMRALVQENALEKMFHDTLFPETLFRGEATTVEHKGGVGDNLIFSRASLLPDNAAPLVPGEDPEPVDETYEQWEVTIQPYGGSTDVHMPTDYVALASIFLKKLQQLGLMAASSLNKAARDVLYNAAMSGWTVADGAAVSTTSLRVKRINGFTHARNPSLSAGSQVRYSAVTASNPLNIELFDNGTNTANTVVAVTPDNPGDLAGPGVLTLGTATTSVADRAYVRSVDRTDITRVGGGNKVDDITASDIPTFADVRSAVTVMRNNKVREATAGYHCHLDPVSESKMFADAEFQRLNTSLPDYYMYRDFALGRILGTVFLSNTECPQVQNVTGGSTASYSVRDPFGGELFSLGSSSTGVRVHRILFIGQEAMIEHYIDVAKSTVSDAGLNGVMADARVTSNGLETNTDNVKIIMRGPQNRNQDKVSLTWAFKGAWSMQTDGASVPGTVTARYKRVHVIEHAE